MHEEPLDLARRCFAHLFEIGTALGFVHFLAHRCDLVVIEVGSAAASIPPRLPALVSVITNVGFDHMLSSATRWRPSPSRNRIIKRGVPVGQRSHRARAARRDPHLARQLGAPLLGRESDFRSEYEQPRSPFASGGTLSIAATGGIRGRFELGLLGEHQAHNAAAAVMGSSACREAAWPCHARQSNGALPPFACGTDRVVARTHSSSSTGPQSPQRGSPDADVGESFRCRPQGVVFAVSSDSSIPRCSRAG